MYVYVSVYMCVFDIMYINYNVLCILNTTGAWC